MHLNKAGLIPQHILQRPREHDQYSRQRVCVKRVEEPEEPDNRSTRRAAAGGRGKTATASLGWPRSAQHKHHLGGAEGPRSRTRTLSERASNTIWLLLDGTQLVQSAVDPAGALHSMSKQAGPRPPRSAASSSFTALRQLYLRNPTVDYKRTLTKV